VAADEVAPSKRIKNAAVAAKTGRVFVSIGGSLSDDVALQGLRLV